MQQARLGVVELRDQLSDVLNRVAYRGERIVVHRRDKDTVAIIPIEDLRLLERLVEEQEDRLDVAAARAARAESDERVPFDEVCRQLGVRVELPDRAAEGRESGVREAAEG